MSPAHCTSQAQTLINAICLVTGDAWRLFTLGLVRAASTLVGSTPR